MRIDEVAGKGWNANMLEIYESANEMAVAVYSLAILNNPAFQKREDPHGRLYAVLSRRDEEDIEDTAELNRRDLADFGAKLTYNSSSPRVFTLHVPGMQPYTFDVKELIDAVTD